MSSNQIVKIVTEVLLSIADTTGPNPRSAIYLACGMNMQLATIVESVMTHNGWIVATSDTIRLTPAGRELVQSAQSDAHKFDNDDYSDSCDCNNHGNCPKCSVPE